jgi:aspartate/methionine/tyrosine aminotransferase
VLADARHFSTDSYRLAFDILDKGHVAVAPGIDFGSNAEGFFASLTPTRLRTSHRP